MDFALSEEQELFRTAIRKYMNNLNGTEAARAVIDGKLDVVKSAASGLAEMGVTAIPVSEESDGLGLGALDLVPVFEETGRVLLPGSQLETLALAVPLLESFGTPAQKAARLPNVASGASTISVAWYEKGTSLFPNSFCCVAAKTENGYALTGTKTLVPVIGDPDVFITGAQTAEGKSLFLVKASDLSSVRTLSVVDETQQLAEVTFDAAPGELLGEPGNAADMLKHGLLHFNAALCSSMVGGMDELVKMTAEYAKIRVQFNQPIGRFQAIKHGIVNMKLDLETARSLSYYAAWAVETDAVDKVAAVHSARSFISKAYIKAAGDSIQIHGGIGFTEELDVQLFLKRARYYENYFGSVRDSRKATAHSLGWHSVPAKRDAVPVS
ncbi:acyl-CoA/acyl-ACP dehydrogenase [Sporosarcina jeotgali]|uniref:Acyl-CoA/acyl-ACP dehydrogenase n=1 Tax=Sporosarcina jeotgali TaxID=3020056 RepID=A0ABZ0L113_9BACL|nr:acyl-CoA dehydrogenase family protein [Sporosarcina sp. B2O-1]WOV84874.1 acyl-CoA/acyl-ACP dehydrogenase [Sporosarcina sp. B2O-1]